ncbi:hypothetical protein [Trichlorobacter lovleyi]|uniref:hypothetical protein n=1 Tax=Trichlorobacter lovleyi TaxID=313985 RepID=UPI0024810C61|nr:hypothetical protein [Trichlorobacter lovleyi]
MQIIETLKNNLSQATNAPEAEAWASALQHYVTAKAIAFDKARQAQMNQDSEVNKDSLSFPNV